MPVLDVEQESLMVEAHESSVEDLRWTRTAALSVYEAPLADLLFRAQAVHRENFDPNFVQRAQLLNIKAGGCPEDCGYCSQSAHHNAGVTPTKLMELAQVLDAARAAKAAGATRYCMGAAWRSPKKRDLPRLVAMIEGVKALGLETCMTLGMLDESDAETLSTAGLDYYNHNIDTSPDFYSQVVTSRLFEERLETIANVRRSGVKVCCGGIVGMGETRDDRVAMLVLLANMPEPPESVPINQLIAVPGTPLGETPVLDPFELVRTVALARILLPRAFVRLSAGRSQMSDELQALCFVAGANSVFIGDRLLTSENPAEVQDAALFARLGICSH